MRTPAAIARRLTRLTLTLALALLAATAMPGAAQLHPYHSTAYVEGNIFGFGPAAEDHFGQSVATGDFNGDGADDLATGIPKDDNLYAQFPNSGIVVVRYGAPGAGLRGGLANTVLTQAWPSSPDDAGSEETFGYALAAGDFNGDGFDDLAVGAREDRAGDGSWGGAVQIYHGSASGVQLSTAGFFAQGINGVPGGGEWDWWFGTAVAAGDFDGDGFDDLAIGQTLFSSGLDSQCGRVVILHGTSTGLSGVGAQTFNEDYPGMDGSNENDDYFGSSLATGDLDGDGFDDLAVGVPGENEGGGVHVIFGSEDGLTAAGNNLWTQSDSDVPGEDEAGDEMGAALAVGDFDGDGFDDVAAGAPGQGFGGAPGAGAVFVLWGSPAGVPGMTWSFVSPGTLGIGSSEGWDDWGRALAAGDFDHDGFDDLAVGAPFESLGTTDHTGEVTILRGYSDGLTAIRGQLLNQGTLGVPDTSETSDLFGFALAAGDFDGNGHDDLVVGAPNESTVYSQDGAATSLYGFVFADDFETNGTGRWGQVNRSLQRYSNGIGTSAAAKLGRPESQYGLSIGMVDGASNLVWVMAGPNQGFAADTTLAGSFFIDPQHLTMSSSPGLNVLTFLSLNDGTGSVPRLSFDLVRTPGDYSFIANFRNDTTGTLQFGGSGVIANAGDANGHNVRLDFAWTAGNPGHLTMWRTRYVGGAPDAAGKVQLFSVDLPAMGTAVVNALYAGLLGGKDPGTFGQLYLDEVQLSR